MRRLCAVLMAGVLAFAGLLAASPAQAYPNVQVTALGDIKVGGRNVTVSASVDPSGVSCTWTVTYNGARGQKTVTDTGSSVTATFRTFEVQKRTVTTVTATCLYDDTAVPTSAGAFGGVPAAVIAAPQTASATANVILLPEPDGDGDDSDDNDDSDDSDDSDSGSGTLPNTGGERLAWLVIGFLLVAAGTTVVVTSRRRTKTS